MDALAPRLAIYDLLSVIVPGSLVVGTGLVIVDLSATNLHVDLLAVSLTQLLVLLALAYVVGHAVQDLARWPAQRVERWRWGARPSEAMLKPGDGMAPARRALLRRAVSRAVGVDDLPDEDFEELAFRISYESVQSSANWPRIEMFVALTDFSRGVALASLASGVSLLATVGLSAWLTDLDATTGTLALLAAILMIAAMPIFVDRFLFFTHLVASVAYDAFIATASLAGTEND